MLPPLRGGRGWTPATTWLAWLLSVFAWAPLTYPGYFEFLNGLAPVFNLDDLFHSGAWLGWAPTIGQGYDLLRGEGPLPYLLAALPRILGLSAVTSIKLVFMAAILMGAYGIYGWARRRLGPWPALLAAAVYVFWPFGLATIYVRGALAEALLLGLLPLAWWTAEGNLFPLPPFPAPRGATSPPGKGRAPVPLPSRGGVRGEVPGRFSVPLPWRGGARGGVARALALAAILAAAFWTQTGLALWLAVSLLAYILVSGWRHGMSLPALAGWAVGVIAGVLGLLPRVLAHGGLGGVTYAEFLQNFVYPYQLLQPVGAPLAGTASAGAGASFQLGLVACGLAALGVILALEGRAASTPAAPGEPVVEASTPARGRLVLVPVILILLPVLLSLNLSLPLWRLLPGLARMLTYPWQLLILTGPWLAWLAGLGGLALQERLAAQPDLRLAGGAGRQGESVTVAGAPTTMALFAGLMVLALLGVYGDLVPPSTPAPVPNRPLAVYGDNQLALVSAVVSPTVAGRVTLRVQWQALRPLNEDYTVFFHAEGPDGAVWGQQDTMPQAGKAPTSGWRPGVIVDDQYTLALQPGAPANTRLMLGLYQWQTGQRLRAGGAEQIVVGNR